MANQQPDSVPPTQEGPKAPGPECDCLGAISSSGTGRVVFGLGSTADYGTLRDISDAGHDSVFCEN